MNHKLIKTLLNEDVDYIQHDNLPSDVESIKQDFPEDDIRIEYFVNPSSNDPTIHDALIQNGRLNGGLDYLRCIINDNGDLILGLIMHNENYSFHVEHTDMFQFLKKKGILTKSFGSYVMGCAILPNKIETLISQKFVQSMMIKCSKKNPSWIFIMHNDYDDIGKIIEIIHQYSNGKEI